MNNFVDRSKRTYPLFMFVVTLSLSSHLKMTTAITAMMKTNITMITIHAVMGPYSPEVKMDLKKNNHVHLSGMGHLVTQARS